MKNLNAEQVKKALECCNSHEKCSECPCTDFCECPSWLDENALAIINSHEQTIKELTEENQKLTINMNAYGLTAKRLAEGNERLKKHEIVYETPFGKQTMPDISSLDGKAAELYKRIEYKIKTDTLLEYDKKVYQLILGWFGDKLSEQNKDFITVRLGQFAKEILEGEK